MTAPPGLPFQLVIQESGTEDGWAYVRADDYLAAIAAAEARGREQGLREAAAKVLNAFAPHASFAIIGEAAADAILALIPAPSPRQHIDLTDMKAVMDELFRLNDLGLLDEGADLLREAVKANGAALERAKLRQSLIDELQKLSSSLAYVKGWNEGVIAAETAFFEVRMKSTPDITRAILSLLRSSDRAGEGTGGSS